MHTGFQRDDDPMLIMLHLLFWRDIIMSQPGNNVGWHRDYQQTLESEKQSKWFVQGWASFLTSCFHHIFSQHRSSPVLFFSGLHFGILGGFCRILLKAKDQGRQKLHRCCDGCFRVSFPACPLLTCVWGATNHAQVFWKGICQPEVKTQHVLFYAFLNHSSLLPPPQPSAAFCHSACCCCPSTHASQSANW